MDYTHALQQIIDKLPKPENDKTISANLHTIHKQLHEICCTAQNKHIACLDSLILAAAETNDKKK